MLLMKIPYILAVLFLFLENMAVGNFAASKERDISKILLSKKIKKMLFPFLYIKRVTYVVFAYQIVNCILFTITLAGLLLMQNGYQRVFQIFWNFQKYYIFCAPFFLYGRLYWINLYGLIRKMRCGVNWVPGLLKELNGKVYRINGNEVTAVKPSDINGSVFIMLEYRNQSITDVFYKNVLCKLSEMNYMLICIDRFPSNDPEKYEVIMKEVLQFFHIFEKPFFYMGCEVDCIFETLKIDHVFKSNGLIWLCRIKRKDTMRYLISNLKFYRYEEIIPDEDDVCVLNTNMRDVEKIVEDWVKEKVNMKQKPEDQEE